MKAEGPSIIKTLLLNINSVVLIGKNHEGKISDFEKR